MTTAIPTKASEALISMIDADDCFQPETMEDLRQHFPTIREALRIYHKILSGEAKLQTEGHDPETVSILWGLIVDGKIGFEAKGEMTADEINWLRQFMAAAKERSRAIKQGGAPSIPASESDREGE